MHDAILRTFGMTLDYLRRLVADVAEEQMTRQPAGAVNHPAWILGHLVYSCQAIGGELGLQPWLSHDWRRRFGTGSTPVADRACYPSKSELLQQLAEGQRRLTERLRELGDAGLKEPLPDERYRSEFPTVADAVLHILGAHAAVHVGQVSVWRRVAGFAPLRDTPI